MVLKMSKRTTHRSSKGTKLYAVKDKNGKWKDIQSYKRVHTPVELSNGARQMVLRDLKLQAGVRKLKAVFVIVVWA